MRKRRKERLAIGASADAGSDLLEVRLGEISDRISRGREQRKWTLANLGKRSKVAPSTIQKIENRQMTPSIAVVLKLAAGLGIEPGDLIAPAQPSHLNVVIERAGQHLRMGASGDIIYDKLSAEIVDAQVECWRIIVPPRYSATLASPVAMLETVMICEKGQVEIDLNHHKYVLRPGDTLHCKSVTFCGLRNLTGRQAEYLNSGRFPHEFRASLARRPKTARKR